jgi:hypothetical protein
MKRVKPQVANGLLARRSYAAHRFARARLNGALFDALGPCWLALQAAILGAASPMNLGLQRQPGRTAFGPDCHPAALLELTTSNAASADWWRAQQSALSSDGDLAVWSLALWCVATPSVVVDIFPEWEEVVVNLPEARRRPVIDAALRCSAHGWVSKLPSALSSPHDQISALLTFRNPHVSQPEAVNTFTRRPTPAPQLPLIEVARERGWFKVDSAGTYR